MRRNEPLPSVTSAVPASIISTQSRFPALAQWWSRPRHRDLIYALIYSSPAIIIFILFTYWPFARAIWLSLHLTNPAGEPVRWNGLGYYARVLSLDGSGRTDYLDTISVSFKYALMVVPIGIIIALALASLATMRVRYIEVFRTIFTSSIAISLASAGVIWSLIYNPSTKATTWLVELLNLSSPTLLNDDSTALIAVAVMSVWSGIGFNFIITLTGIQAISRDLYESAAIDGAGGWRSFRYITLPMLSPTLLFLVVINTIGSLQAFTQFALLIPDRRPNVFVYETYRAFWVENRYGLASAMSLILFAMLLVLTLIQYFGLNRRVHYQ